MFQDHVPKQAVFMGLLAAFVGYASSFAVVLQGLRAVGATELQAVSGLTALTLAMGLCGVLMSWWTRMPASIAWSTPGAALLVASQGTGVDFHSAIGGFLICAVMLVITGLIRPLGRLVSAIPGSLAAAMLAGVLFSLCLAPMVALGEDPLAAGLIIVAWFIGGRLHRFAAVPAALGAFIVIVLTGLAAADPSAADPTETIPSGFGLFLTPLMPQFDLGSVLGIALPLFIVNMASQNIPGMAVLVSNGYKPNAGRLFTWTGVFSLGAAPFGGHAVNMAAITAALCAGEDVDPNPARRWWAAATAGVAYCVIAFFVGPFIAFVSLAPPILIAAVAGLALIGSFTGAITGAFADPDEREAAGITFLVTASGFAVFGIGSAFWGLLAGGLLLFAIKAKKGL
ncbi:MAG: benzoate/H(+) symporter BenE family transporter [Rhodospirillaceae bacterium]